MSADAEQIAERFEDAMAQWPTLEEMVGCVDCKHVFRVAVANRCARCQGQSLLNLAELLRAGVKTWRDVVGSVLAAGLTKLWINNEETTGADSRQDLGDVTAPNNDESDRQEDSRMKR
jgi:hypothetical protein